MILLGGGGVAVGGCGPLEVRNIMHLCDTAMSILWLLTRV